MVTGDESPGARGETALPVAQGLTSPSRASSGPHDMADQAALEHSSKPGATPNLGSSDPPLQKYLEALERGQHLLAELHAIKMELLSDGIEAPPPYLIGYQEKLQPNRDFSDVDQSSNKNAPGEGSPAAPVDMDRMPSEPWTLVYAAADYLNRALRLNEDSRHDAGDINDGSPSRPGTAVGGHSSWQYKARPATQLPPGWHGQSRKRRLDRLADAHKTGSNVFSFLRTAEGRKLQDIVGLKTTMKTKQRPASKIWMPSGSKAWADWDKNMWQDRLASLPPSALPSSHPYGTPGAPYLSSCSGSRGSETLSVGNKNINSRAAAKHLQTSATQTRYERSPDGLTVEGNSSPGARAEQSAPPGDVQALQQDTHFMPERVNLPPGERSGTGEVQLIAASGNSTPTPAIPLDEPSAAEDSRHHAEDIPVSVSVDGSQVRTPVYLPGGRARLQASYADDSYDSASASATPEYPPARGLASNYSRSPAWEVQSSTQASKLLVSAAKRNLISELTSLASDLDQEVTLSRGWEDVTDPKLDTLKCSMSEASEGGEGASCAEISAEEGSGRAAGAAEHAAVSTPDSAVVEHIRPADRPSNAQSASPAPFVPDSRPSPRAFKKPCTSHHLPSFMLPTSASEARVSSRSQAGGSKYTPWRYKSQAAASSRCHATAAAAAGGQHQSGRPLKDGFSPVTHGQPASGPVASKAVESGTGPVYKTPDDQSTVGIKGRLEARRFAFEQRQQQQEEEQKKGELMEGQRYARLRMQRSPPTKVCQEGLLIQESQQSTFVRTASHEEGRGDTPIVCPAIPIAASLDAHANTTELLFPDPPLRPTPMPIAHANTTELLCPDPPPQSVSSLESGPDSVVGDSDSEDKGVSEIDSTVSTIAYEGPSAIGQDIWVLHSSAAASTPVSKSSPTSLNHTSFVATLAAASVFGLLPHESRMSKERNVFSGGGAPSPAPCMFTQVAGAGGTPGGTPGRVAAVPLSCQDVQYKYAATAAMSAVLAYGIAAASLKQSRA